MTTLLHTTEGCSPMHELIEREQDEHTMTPERAQWWEAVRAQCNTIGARAALDWAMNDMEERDKAVLEVRQQNQTK